MASKVVDYVCQRGIVWVISSEDVSSLFFSSVEFNLERSDCARYLLTDALQDEEVEDLPPCRTRCVGGGHWALTRTRRRL